MTRGAARNHAHQLAETIARKKARLRILEARQRQQAKAHLQARYIAAGKVVEACGLLDADLGKLERIVKRGIAATMQEETTAQFSHGAQGDADPENEDMRANTFLYEKGY